MLFLYVSMNAFKFRTVSVKRLHFTRIQKYILLQSNTVLSVRKPTKDTKCVSFPNLALPTSLLLLYMPHGINERFPYV
jgi:hypothetical protein